MYVLGELPRKLAELFYTFELNLALSLLVSGIVIIYFTLLVPPNPLHLRMHSVFSACDVSVNCNKYVIEYKLRYSGINTV